MVSMRPANKVLAFLYDCCQLAGWFLGSIRTTFRSRHIKHLEAENARMVAENRALWQAVAKSRGVAVDLPDDITHAMTEHPEARTNGASERASRASGTTRQPHIRGSWPQIQAKLEQNGRDALMREAKNEVEKHLQAMQHAPVPANGAGQMPPPEPKVEAEA